MSVKGRDGCFPPVGIFSKLRQWITNKLGREVFRLLYETSQLESEGMKTYSSRPTWVMCCPFILPVFHSLLTQPWLGLMQRSRVGLLKISTICMVNIWLSFVHDRSIYRLADKICCENSPQAIALELGCLKFNYHRLSNFRPVVLVLVQLWYPFNTVNNNGGPCYRSLRLHQCV